MENSIANINEGRPVYFSYARNSSRKPEWEHISDCVDTLLNTLTANHIEYRVDVKDIGMGDKISNFEQEIGWYSELVVIIFSDKYFRSMHCMYELVQIKRALEKYPDKRLMCIKSGDFNLSDINYIRELERYWGTQKLEYEDIEYHRLREHSETEKAAWQNGFYLDDIRKLYSFFSAFNYANAANINYDVFVSDIEKYYKTTPKQTPKPAKDIPQPPSFTAQSQQYSAYSQPYSAHTQPYIAQPKPHVQQFTQNERAASTPQPANKKSPAIPIAIAAVVLCFIIFLGLFLLGNDSTSDDGITKQTPTTTEPTTTPTESTVTTTEPTVTTTEPIETTTDNNTTVADKPTDTGSEKTDKPVKDNDSPSQTTSTSIGGHEYVDLGLPSGTLWATCNIGASSPEKYGDYFAWGETKPKSDYTWSTLKYCEDNTGDKFSKYNTKPEYGKVDNKTTLESTDDAATANWGSDWCMPTQAQFQELNDKCTWIWTTKNGKKGYEVKGPNGKTIFLPAAGYRYGTSLSSVGSDGYYWSSSLNTVSPNGGCYLYFLSGYVGPDHWGSRYFGLSVRPVRSK